MDSPSSTSSSERATTRLPLAGLLAILLLVVLDRSVYRSETLWRAFHDRLSSSAMLEQGLVLDRIALFGADRASVGRSVFLVGSSRLNRGFQFGAVSQRNASGAHFTKLAHPQFFPFEIRAAVEEILPRSPDVVLLALSELEIHTRLKFIPGSSYGNLSGIRDLIEVAGPSFVFERRTMLQRIALEGVFNSYHYRGVLNRSGLALLRKFERDNRLKVSNFPERSVDYLDGIPKEISLEDLKPIVDELDARFKGRGSIIYRAQFGLLRSISLGQHAEINKELVRRSVELLRGAGIEVALIEPPLYPGARQLYDREVREDFVRFAETLVREYQVRFVSLDDQPEYLNEDFGDLTHLVDKGVEKFTRAVLDAVGE